MTSPAAFLASFSTTSINHEITLTNNIFDVFDGEAGAIFEALDAQEEGGLEDAGPLGRTELLQEVSHSLAREEVGFQVL